MKKTVLFILIAALLIPFAAFAEEAQEIPTAAIGDAEFSFTNEQVYFDLAFLYPDGLDTEIKEEPDRVRYLYRYYVEGYEKPAVGLVVSRTKAYATPEDRLTDIAFINEVTAEEINGVSWAVGIQSDYSVIIYARAAGEYVYTFSFSTDYPEDFDFREFARVFAEGVTDAE